MGLINISRYICIFIYIFFLAPAFNSEPTELERQREISSVRLKKVFGLSVEENRPGKSQLFS